MASVFGDNCNHLPRYDHGLTPREMLLLVEKHKALHGAEPVDGEFLKSQTDLSFLQAVETLALSYK